MKQHLQRFQNWLTHLNKVEIGIILGFIVCSVAVWWQSQYYPYFWDSTYVIHTAKTIYDSNLTDFVSHEPGYSHPTLWPTMLAVAWKIFGESLRTSHLLVLPFLPMLLISSYYFFKKISNRNLAIIASLLILTAPTVLAEYVNVYMDLPSTALAVMALALWVHKKYFFWGLIYSLALLTKIPTLIVSIYFFTDALLTNRRLLLATIVVPFAVLGGWLAYHYFKTGWLFVSPNIKARVFQINYEMFSLFVYTVRTFFSSQGRLPLVLTLIISIIYVFQKKLFSKQLFMPLIPLAALILGGIAFFTLSGEFHVRYGVTLYVAYIALIIFILNHISYKFPNLTYHIWILASLTVFFQIAVINPPSTTWKTYHFNAPADLGITDYIYLFRWVSFRSAMLTTSSDVAFYGGFPENVALSEPIMHFLTKPLNFLPCDKFQYEPKKSQYIIVQPFSPTQFNCKYIVDHARVEPIDRQERNGKWIEILKVLPATSSASTSKTAL